ncbi:unnamed protein product [Rotaria sordida]|uniref:Phosphoinositide phospholipase C n=1 Tax=Rotaria sordida TaxID=392033 RepID=A0A814E9W8_9BILA|nr:unnamed protein product [Rotaria sordida]
MNVELRAKGLLSLDGFRNMLLSKNFDITESLYSRKIYQDMTRPLCDYYINTSHNTQLTGKSNPEAYNRVLLMGCRAVEFDCYDGNNGRPIVKHAYTLVKPCSFESIIRYIEPNLFKTSPYPVILNIENHCSSEQQKQLARILKTILGDRLITKPLFNKNPSILPSPEDLKYKVLVRDVEPELAELFIYLQNVPYREYNYAKIHYSAFHSSSLSENQFLKLAEQDPIGLVQQTTWRLLRLYPDGFRQDSSNPDPINAWNFGVQMVALNYQTSDDMMALYNGKFLANGSCGYILKPDYLIKAQETEFNPWNGQTNFDCTQILTIKIISGQFLPRLNSKSKDILDPYVNVSTHGIPCDHRIQKTKVIHNNGFDPIWNETFQFTMRFPQMCLIYFSVIDYDLMSHDDRIAYFCSPVTMIQSGYRHIHLKANNNDPIYSTLFVYIDIQNDNDNDDENIIHVRF